MFGANVVLCCVVLYKVFNCFIIYSTVCFNTVFCGNIMIKQKCYKMYHLFFGSIPIATV